jgi:apolipoprotein N-acyltransferase
MLVDSRLRTIEKKMWTIAGALTVISFVVSPIGQRILKGALTSPQQSSIIQTQ